MAYLRSHRAQISEPAEVPSLGILPRSCKVLLTRRLTLVLEPNELSEWNRKRLHYILWNCRSQSTNLAHCFRLDAISLVLLIEVKYYQPDIPIRENWGHLTPRNSLSERANDRRQMSEASYYSETAKVSRIVGCDEIHDFGSIWIRQQLAEDYNIVVAPGKH